MYRLLPPAAPLMFSQTRRPQLVHVIAYGLLSLTLFVLFYRASLRPQASRPIESKSTSNSLRKNWPQWIERQWPVFLGLFALCWQKFGWALEYMFARRTLVGNLFFAMVWHPWMELFGNPLHIAIVIALGMYAWQVRTDRTTDFGHVIRQRTFGAIFLETALTLTHLLALSMAMFVLCYSSSAVWPSPIDFLVPRQE